MSKLTIELPEVVVKPGKMFNFYFWSTRMKVGVFLLALALYVYFLLFIKTLYLKSKRLDRIMALALETEKQILKIHTMDQNLAMQMEHLDELFEDYEM